jgi:hypothetical protein
MAERDRLLGTFGALVERILDRLGYTFGALYPARIVHDHGNGLVDVVPDDAVIDGQQQVPLRMGAPGQTVTVPSGARLRMGFDVRDPSRPFAGLWEDGTTPLTWSQKASDLVTIDADAIDLGAAAGVVARDGDAIEIWIPNPVPPPNEIVIATGYLRVISLVKSKVRA